VLLLKGIAMTTFSLILSMVLTLHLSDNTTAIEGMVRYQDLFLEGAEIYLLSESSETALKVVTDQTGNFSFVDIKPDKYKVIALSSFFAPVERDVSVEEGETAFLEFALVPDAGKEIPIQYINPRQKDLDSFSPALEAFEEPPFCSDNILSQKYESYRFLYLRSFHKPVLINLKYGPNVASITYKELDNNGDVEFGSLSIVKEITVRKRMTEQGLPKEINVQSFLEHISGEARMYVWKQPFKIKQGLGVDGATWTIEGVKEGKCHVVTRWSPDRADPIRIFAETLIQLSGNRFYYDEVY
jgi:hypothetical protein